MRKPLLIAAVAVAAITIAIVVLRSEDEARPAAAPAYLNGDLANTRQVSDSPISLATIKNLRVAWSVPIAVHDGYSTPPVVSRGVLYTQDLGSDVHAMDLRTGKVLWDKEYHQPTLGPTGVVVADGRVYGATMTSAFALDQKTGRELWSVKLVRNRNEGIDMTPGYHDGVVFVSTVPVNYTKYYAGNGVGVLWALDGKTGRKVWTFDTAPRDLWSARHVDSNSGGGLWYPPAFDDEGGMYVGVGNPGPYAGTGRFPWGSSRPGRNLYTNSLVKLDVETGRVRWYYQLTPHDLYDWDLQDPPILTRVKGREAVVTAGKGGIVIAVDRDRGKLLWRRSVGLHNGHDRDGVYAMRHQYDKLKLPATIYPGLEGGVIAPMATDGKTVYVPVVNHGTVFLGHGRYDTTDRPDDAHLMALDVETGKVRWDRKLSGPSFGAVTVVNDLVFTTVFDGLVVAYEARSGRLAWQGALPVETNAGVTVTGDTVVAPAGFAGAGTPAIVAFRLGD